MILMSVFFCIKKTWNKSKQVYLFIYRQHTYSSRSSRWTLTYRWWGNKTIENFVSTTNFANKEATKVSETLWGNSNGNSCPSYAFAFHLPFLFPSFAFANIVCYSGNGLIFCRLVGNTKKICASESVLPTYVTNMTQVYQILYSILKSFIFSV